MYGHIINHTHIHIKTRQSNDVTLEHNIHAIYNNNNIVGSEHKNNNNILHELKYWIYARILSILFCVYGLISFSLVQNISLAFSSADSRAEQQRPANVYDIHLDAIYSDICICYKICDVAVLDDAIIECLVELWCLHMWMKMERAKKVPVID